MTLAHFLQHVSIGLTELFEHPLPWRAQQHGFYQAQRRLQASLAAIGALRARIRALSNQRAGHLSQEKSLAQRIEIYLNVGDQPNAYQLALQLDKLRSILRKERAYLVQLGKFYCRHVEAIRALRDEVADLRAQLEEQA